MRIDEVLKKRKLGARKREFSDFLWDKYHVRRTEVDLGPEGLHTAIRQTPGAAIATWDGANLTVKDFAAPTD